MKVSLLLSGFKCRINEQRNSMDHVTTVRQNNFSYVFDIDG